MGSLDIPVDADDMASVGGLQWLGLFSFAGLVLRKYWSHSLIMFDYVVDTTMPFGFHCSLLFSAPYCTVSELVMS
jgi:hypothetical protein